MGDKRDVNLIDMPMTSPSVEYHNVPNRVSLKNVKKIRQKKYKNRKFLSKWAFLIDLFYKKKRTDKHY